MKWESTKNLKGGECLAQPVISEGNIVLIYEKTILKKEYIEKLDELGIPGVFIEEKESDYNRITEIDILSEEVKEDYRKVVKRIMEKHVYRLSSDMIEMQQIADDIILGVLNQKEILQELVDMHRKSNDIYEHSIAVCTLSVLTALSMKIDLSRVHDIASGALLHDIGFRYLQIPDIMNRFTAIKEEDEAEYRMHPIYGYSAMENETWLNESAKKIILLHHELLNGTGYPLKQKKLSDEVKIVSICNTFDCMISGIGCEKSMVYQVVEYFRQNKNILFDEKCVNAFLELIAIYPIGSKVLTNEGELAIVIKQNKGFQERPVLKIIKDKKGNTLKDSVIKDMLEEHTLFIKEVLE